MADSDIKVRMEKLVDSLNEGLHERREHVAVALLAALSGQNIFLLGPPGTAKSLLARRLSSIFNLEDNSDSYFEYLMHRFSTPEDIFGPVSIAGLKEDKYTRKIKGFLPSARFAFLDEIWKSGPAVLNTLLTIINEKKFRNGAELCDVPLKTLIAASNETPPEGQGLEALYDRFIVRLYSPPIKKVENFEKFLQEKAVADCAACNEFFIHQEEWDKWLKGMREVRVSPETMTVIRVIRLRLAERGDPESMEQEEKSKVYVSDRRWKKAVSLLQAGAYFCGRTTTNLADTMLLCHCLWTTVENKEEVIRVVTESVRESGFVTDLDSSDIVEKKENLRKEINSELFHTENVYETTKLGGEEKYFQGKVKRGNHGDDWIDFYIPEKQIRLRKEFRPVDADEEQIEWLLCAWKKKCFFVKSADGGGVMSPDNKDWSENISFTPKVLFKKGARNKSVNPRLIDDLRKSVKEISKELDDVIQDIERKKNDFEAEMDSPFISASDKCVAMEGINDQLQKFMQERKDCDLLLNDIDGKS